MGAVESEGARPGAIARAARRRARASRRRTSRIHRVHNCEEGHRGERADEVSAGGSVPVEDGAGGGGREEGREDTPHRAAIAPGHDGSEARALGAAGRGEDGPAHGEEWQGADEAEDRARHRLRGAGDLADERAGRGAGGEEDGEVARRPVGREAGGGVGRLDLVAVAPARAPPRHEEAGRGGEDGRGAGGDDARLLGRRCQEGVLEEPLGEPPGGSADDGKGEREARETCGVRHGFWIGQRPRR
jgi:hypothetical protein